MKRSAKILKGGISDYKYLGNILDLQFCTTNVTYMEFINKQISKFQMYSVIYFNNE